VVILLKGEYSIQYSCQPSSAKSRFIKTGLIDFTDILCNLGRNSKTHQSAVNMQRIQLMPNPVQKWYVVSNIHGKNFVPNLLLSLRKPLTLILYLQ